MMSRITLSQLKIEEKHNNFIKFIRGNEKAKYFRSNFGVETIRVGDLFYDEEDRRICILTMINPQNFTIYDLVTVSFINDHSHFKLIPFTGATIKYNDAFPFIFPLKYWSFYTDLIYVDLSFYKSQLYENFKFKYTRSNDSICHIFFSHFSYLCYDWAVIYIGIGDFQNKYKIPYPYVKYSSVPQTLVTMGYNFREFFMSLIDKGRFNIKTMKTNEILCNDDYLYLARQMKKIKCYFKNLNICFDDHTLYIGKV